MSKEMMFGSIETNNVNVNTQGSQIAKRQIANLESKPKDTNIASIAQGAMVAADAFFQVNNAVDADQAKRDYLNIVRSPGYLEANDVTRAEMFEEQYTAIADRSNAYQEAFSEYSNKAYVTAYDGRLTEENNALYNKMGSLYTVWQRSNPDKDASMFVDEATTVYPSLDRGAIKNSLMLEVQGEYLFALEGARTPTELKEIESYYAEKMMPFKNPHFLTTRSKQGMDSVNAFNSSITTAKNNKLKYFSAMEANAIALANDHLNPDLSSRYTKIPEFSKYQTAYGDKAASKFQDDTHKFKEYNNAREVVSSVNLFDTNNWTSYDETTNKMLQQSLTESILNGITDAPDLAGELIVKHGSVDAARVKDIKEYFDSGLSSDNIVERYNELKRLKAVSPASFNMLYPDRDERANILTIDVLATLTGGDYKKAYEIINSAPDITPEKTTVAQQNKVNSMIHDEDIPADMRKDLDVMYKTMGKYGVPHDKRIKALEEYADSKPYELTFSNLDSDAKDMAMERIAEMKLDPDSNLFNDPTTGMIMEENQYGIKTPLISKQKFEDYTFSIKKIKQYNDEHYIQQGFQSFGDYITSKVAAVESHKGHGTQMRYTNDRETVDLTSDDPLLNIFNMMTNDINLGTGQVTKHKGGN